MEFLLSMDDLFNYVVNVRFVNEYGYMVLRPIKNFGSRQGDAKLFKTQASFLSSSVILKMIKSYGK